MAIFHAITDGVWSDATIWSPATVPESNDEVYANGFTITIDQTVDVTLLSTEAASGISAGGVFKILLPALSDVRKSVTYSKGVGTLAVPTPEQVAYGIPVDTTVGTALIRLPDLSTITGHQIEAAFDITNQ